MTKPSAVVVGVGAERGLGAALCRRFAQGGCHVLIAGRTAAKINKVAETIVSAGGSAEPIAKLRYLTLIESMPKLAAIFGCETVARQPTPIRVRVVKR